MTLEARDGTAGGLLQGWEERSKWAPTHQQGNCLESKSCRVYLPHSIFNKLFSISFSIIRPCYCTLNPSWPGTELARAPPLHQTSRWCLSAARQPRKLSTSCHYHKLKEHCNISNTESASHRRIYTHQSKRETACLHRPAPARKRQHGRRRNRHWPTVPNTARGPPTVPGRDGPRCQGRDTTTTTVAMEFAGNDSPKGSS